MVNHPSCRICGYDLAGLESPRCPECGGEVSTPLQSDFHAAREYAAAKRLKCRHCKRPLSEMVEGVCACGARYQLASALPDHHTKTNLSLVDGVTVIAAIIGFAIALLAFIFTGTARNRDPKWGAVVLACVPGVGLFIAVISRRMLIRVHADLRSMVNWFFVVISAVCLIGAVVLLS